MWHFLLRFKPALFVLNLLGTDDLQDNRAWKEQFGFEGMDVVGIW